MEVVKRKLNGEGLEYVYDKVETLVANKQDKLQAGDNITITGNVISATGGGGGSAYDDTEVRALIAANTADITINTEAIAENTASIAEVKTTADATAAAIGDINTALTNIIGG